MPDSDIPRPIRHICVVCTGNICRSPMGEVILAAELQQQHPDWDIKVSSCGLGGWHIGDGADPRAVTQLEQQGYDGSHHVAAQFGAEHEQADVFLAMDKGHVRGLRGLGVDPRKIHLFRAFDAASVTVGNPQPEVADPYYGSQRDFAAAGEQIAAAVPGIVEFLAEHRE